VYEWLGDVVNLISIEFPMSLRHVSKEKEKQHNALVFYSVLNCLFFFFVVLNRSSEKPSSLADKLSVT
jgi:hypothetical protein